MNSVLFVDDEILITNSLRRGLIDEKYSMFFANSGEDALRIMDNEAIDVLVTDMKMPEMNGLQLLKIVKDKFPDTIRIVLSGYTQLPQVLITVNQASIFKFITKPWNLEQEFKYVIREAIEFYNFKAEQRNSKEILEKKNVTFQNMLRKYDNVIKEVKEEVEQVIIMNNHVFDEINHRILNWDRKKIAPEAFVEDIRNYEDFITSVMAVIPTTTKRFTIKSIVDELKLYLRDNKSMLSFDFGIDDKIGCSYRGKYEFIIQVLKNIITFLVRNSMENHVSVIITEKDSDDDNANLMFIFEMKQDVLKPMETVENLISLMKILIESIHGNLSVRPVNDQMVILLSAQFQK